MAHVLVYYLSGSFLEKAKLYESFAKIETSNVLTASLVETRARAWTTWKLRDIQGFAYYEYVIAVIEAELTRREDPI